LPLGRKKETHKKRDSNQWFFSSHHFSSHSLTMKGWGSVNTMPYPGVSTTTS
jgi:hypothetical protein